MHLVLPVLTVIVVIAGWAYLGMRRSRERAGNAPLRGEIEARVCFATPLYRACVLGSGGFRGTRGQWIPLRGPKRLTVGTDAFMISAPQALREFVFTGCESSIAFRQKTSGQAERPWIVITGQAADGREVKLAITMKDGLQEIWQALAGTGAVSVLA
jgi:hypothetical protein